MLQVTPIMETISIIMLHSDTKFSVQKNSMYTTVEHNKPPHCKNNDYSNSNM